MRKLLTWLLVSLGIAAIVRKLRRRGEQPVTTTAEPAVEDPADELRRKLAETRTEETDEGVSAPPAVEASVEERRAEVHDQGRATLQEMQPPDED